jgi:3-hydroxyisobutyrate dehydrogenase-like beta-hydroxyacid dehydrogenase
VAALTVALLGLGEAGSVIARELVAAGVTVRAFDPAGGADVAGVQRAAEARAAVDGSDVVLSLTAASAALDAARDVAGVLREDQVYADLNASGAGLKRAVAEVVAPTGARFADVALMGVVPRDGLGTPALVSGPGAEAFAAHLGPLGMPVEVLSDEPGVAAARKLLRSVFMKGLAASCLESLRAARAAGCEDWMRAEIEGVLAGADAALLERLVSGSARHATRRIAEVADARELLAELGVEPRVTVATGGWLTQLEGESDAAT